MDLSALLIGLMTLRADLATEDPDTSCASVAPDEVAGILCRHLEAAVARHAGPGPAALDAAG